MPNETPLKKPLWTEEFSVQAAEDKYVLRRQFSKFLVLTSFGMLAGNAWIWAKSLFSRSGGHEAFPRQVVVANASEIPVGGVKTFNYPSAIDNCILVRTAPDRYVAYSQKCTHLSCAVYYSQQNRRLECPCHEGYFSIEDGSVLQGPPPRPLPKIELQRQGDQLVAVRVIANAEAHAQ
jgi:nitrite reductase/ring-hydroxylating ferredoxin subunit